MLTAKLSDVWAEEAKRPNPRLRRALARTFLDMLLIYIVLQAMKSAAVLGMTQFLAVLLDYLGTPSAPAWEGCVSVALSLSFSLF